MRLKGILLTLVVLLGVVFALTNWGVLTAPVAIDLLFFTVRLPLGLSLLLIAVGLALLFFAVSLVDRAGQLRQITQLERQNEALRARLESRRLEELEQLDAGLRARLDALEESLTARVGRAEGDVRERMSEFEMRTVERFEEVRDRVVLVRNELAADVAEAEDAIVRRMGGPVPERLPDPERV